MPKKKLSLAERKKLLEQTKQKLRLQQEARTIARIEELDIEACERLGRQLQLEHKELSGELIGVFRNRHCKAVHTLLK
jgi:hypothetical protein